MRKIQAPQSEEVIATCKTCGGKFGCDITDVQIKGWLFQRALLTCPYCYTKCYISDENLHYFGLRRGDD